MWLAGILLLPVPFMFAYLEFGYPAASAVLVVVIVFREVYRRWKKSKSGFERISEGNPHTRRLDVVLRIRPDRVVPWLRGFGDSVSHLYL